MQANEFRRGNWVKWRGVNHKIESISKSEIVIDWHYPESITTVEDIEPIQLTHEILQQAGFSKNIYGYWYEDIEIKLNDDGTYQMSVGEAEFIIGQPFKYVHELQNNCYWPYKKELKIEL